MHLRLFLSTFALIFLAELGDKTQLAAMARAAAGPHAKWIVFAAASAALVLSTLLAVLFGTAITRVVPEQVIKVAAGALFVVFGAMILIGALKPARAPVAEAAPGALSRLVCRIAAEFEETASGDYRRLAAEAASAGVRALLSGLADEERAHLDRLRRAEIADHTLAASDRQVAELRPPARIEGRDDEAVLKAARDHEEVTARFYGELARLTPLPALRHIFSALAEEEQAHAARLQAMLDASPAPPAGAA